MCWIARVVAWCGCRLFSFFHYVRDAIACCLLSDSPICFSLFRDWYSFSRTRSPFQEPMYFVCNVRACVWVSLCMCMYVYDVIAYLGHTAATNTMCCVSSRNQSGFYRVFFQLVICAVAVVIFALYNFFCIFNDKKRGGGEKKRRWKENRKIATEVHIELFSFVCFCLPHIFYSNYTVKFAFKTQCRFLFVYDSHFSQHFFPFHFFSFQFVVDTE